MSRKPPTDPDMQVLKFFGACIVGAGILLLFVRAVNGAWW